MQMVQRESAARFDAAGVLPSEALRRPDRLRDATASRNARAVRLVRVALRSLWCGEILSAITLALARVLLWGSIALGLFTGLAAIVSCVCVLAIILS